MVAVIKLNRTDLEFVVQQVTKVSSTICSIASAAIVVLVRPASSASALLPILSVIWPASQFDGAGNMEI